MRRSDEQREKKGFWLSRLIFLTAATSFISGAAGAAEWACPFGGGHYVYAESNVAGSGKNSILAYRALADGSLEALAGSPFSTGGSGFVDSSFALGPFDSDQNITVNPQHTYLFAVNSGSNSIAVFHIHKDGSLVAVKGSPFASGGVQPVSVGFSNGALVVVNKHQDPAQASDKSLPNYTVFRVNHDGQLSSVAGSTVEVAPGSSPSQALVHHGLVFGADFMGGLVQSFALRMGHLIQNTPLTLPDSAFQNSTAPRFPLGLEVNPQAPVLYVGYPTVSKLGVYRIKLGGDLQFAGTAANSGMAICWLKSNRNGTRLYTTNSADHSISVYDTTDALKPTEIQKLVVTSQSGLYQLALSASGKLIYVIEQHDAATVPAGQGNAIHVLKVDAKTGAISELKDKMVPLNLPGLSRAQGIVAL